MTNRQTVFCTFANIQIALKVGSAIKLTCNSTGKSGLYEVTDIKFNESNGCWTYTFTHRQKSHVFDTDTVTLKRSDCCKYNALPVTKNSLMDSEQPRKPMSDLPSDEDEDEDEDEDNVEQN